MENIEEPGKKKMDFSKFSDADFDAKEWVNGALRAHKDARIPIDVSRKPYVASCKRKHFFLRRTPRH